MYVSVISILEVKSKKVKRGNSVKVFFTALKTKILNIRIFKILTRTSIVEFITPSGAAKMKQLVYGLRVNFWRRQAIFKLGSTQ